MHPETKTLSWQSSDGSIEAELLPSKVFIPTDDATKIYFIIIFKSGTLRSANGRLVLDLENWKIAFASSYNGRLNARFGLRAPLPPTQSEGTAQTFENRKTASASSYNGRTSSYAQPLEGPDEQLPNNLFKELYTNLTSATKKTFATQYSTFIGRGKNAVNWETWAKENLTTAASLRSMLRSWMNSMNERGLTILGWNQSDSTRFRETFARGIMWQAQFNRMVREPCSRRDAICRF